MDTKLKSLLTYTVEVVLDIMNSMPKTDDCSNQFKLWKQHLDG
jgi:hypothetical protein